MARYPEVKRLDPATVEQETLARWQAAGIFQRSIDARADAPAFSFYEGPPTANGRPGIHHVMGRTVKDAFCRYKTMKGCRVERKAGWDTHGLPVEIEVEKQLGLEGRHQVEEYGVERYNRACRESVLRYKQEWDDLTTRMGYWVDLEHPYVTFESAYIETLWWLIRQMYDKGLLYKGYKIQWYSPGSGTVLSSHEVSQGYREVQDPSVYVRFPARDHDGAALLAWTTTPWTLISNTALAVGPRIEYVKVRRATPEGHELLILARERLGVLGGEAEVIAAFPGSELVGLAYAPPFDYFAGEPGAEAAWRVVAADFVSTEDGTGIVHMAPAFGADDFEVGRREGLPLFNPVTPEGRFTEQAPLVAGEWFKDADKKIVRDLKERGLLFRQETYLHNYPHDWRKHTPLISYPVESWFIRTTALKDRLIALNETIRWQPESMGSGRFGEWLKNNIDWALSRRRYWGTPLPIWVSDAPGSDYLEVVGSIAELRAKCGDQLPPRDEDLDLHRPFVDQLTWPAPDGGVMRRVPDLIDVWFDSGAMPFAQWHYPFENREIFERSFPADFIAEGVDQTRGWFYTLHAIATLVMDSVAYRNVLVNGLVLDEHGEKMSKSKGNAVNPFETIAEYGADVVRWYMMSNTPPWENIKFSRRGLDETGRKFFSTLANVYAFFATYANIDGFRYEASPRIPVGERAELDRWIVSRLHTAVEAVDGALADYTPTRAARTVERFVDELSNWYVRRSRRRFWKEEGGAHNKTAAYQTVFECLRAAAQLMAPIAPFYADWLYRALLADAPDDASVHLTDFPAPVAHETDARLEHRMGLARAISSVVLSLRNACGINVRQPLPKILIVTSPSVAEEDLQTVAEVIRDEVNVKAIEYVGGAGEVVRRTLKPDFRRLGKRLGKRMKAVAEHVKSLSGEDVQRFVETGTLVVEVEGEAVTLEADEVEVVSEGLHGWLVGQEGGATVALDTTITPELAAEGYAREVVNRIQNARKSAGLDVTDRIAVAYAAPEAVQEAIRRFEGWIRNETLALELEQTENPDGAYAETYEIGSEQLRLALRKI